MRFEVHWCNLPPTGQAPGTLPNQRLALWPAPVNPDQCFSEAGFTDFEDSDAAWDREASALLARIVSELESHGPAILKSAPLFSRVPWFLRLFREPVALPMLEQLALPMHWDSLPSCRVVFGNAGASLRTGNGHFIMWVTLPGFGEDICLNFASKVASGHPLFRTPLKWDHLDVA